ncbi:MAG TPA: ATP-binding protein, partial [Flavobacteriales bacterium]|nr:ATP-binding protein [Flavobacteriales bacterium]
AYETERKQQHIEALERDKELQVAREAEQQARLQRQQQLAVGAILIAVLLMLVSALAYRAFRVKREAAAELERKNAEVLQQKERAEESEHAKDRFLANMSHEVRTPLNAIMGFTGLLMQDATDERTARFLSNIREAGDNLLVVINDVLDLSRIEAGRLHLIKEPFDLHRCLHLCAEILQHRAVEQRNVLRVDIAADVPHWVAGDSARLTQIILNLAGNALKFTTQGTVLISVAGADKGLLFKVSDTGIGIPKEKIGQVFERFTQVHVDDRRMHGGTGLGLSIVKELVLLYKGRIDVQSEVGQGTRFSVWLPLEAVGAPPAALGTTPAPRAERLDGRTVLLAEDNDMNALVTEETLVRAFPRTRVERVRNGEEVLERMAHADDIALVLMDVQMPRLDGVSATRAIRQMTGNTRNVPIIALTASVLPNDLGRCIDAGMDACVPKPFKTDELLAAIARATGSTAVPLSAPPTESLASLFQRMVPERLNALRAARARNDLAEMLRVVHGLRPQLVHRDAALFDPLCTRILAFDPNDPPANCNEAFDALEHALERALA